jgi:hypothetical protein
MGVLTDYFRAADTAPVVRALKRPDGGPLVGVKRAARTAGDDLYRWTCL